MLFIENGGGHFEHFINLKKGILTPCSMDH